MGYTATQGDDSALPGWLSFTEGSRSFSGTPQAANVGTLSVKVTASDGNGGSVSDTFTITVSPAAPVGLVATPGPGEREVTLTWSNPNNNLITKYQYHVQERNDSPASYWRGWQDMPNSDADTVRFTVTHFTNSGNRLTAGFNHIFVIRAVAGPLNGAESAYAYATPPSAATLKAPTGLTAVTGPNSGEVTLRWDDPGNLAISGYQVRVAFDDNGVDRWGAWSAMAGSNHDTIRHVVKGLTADVLHAFTIRAVGGNQNDVHSPEATIVYATPPAASTLKAPTGLVATPGPNTNGATVTWDDPNNPVISGYETRIRRTGSNWSGRWISIIDSDASTVSRVFAALNGGGTFEVQLRAVAGAVKGPASPIVTLTPATAAVTLAAPVGLVATPGPGSGQVTLRWDDPNNKLISKYQYRVATDDNGVDNWGAWTDISPSNRNTVRYVITGLTPGSPVKVTIKAFAGRFVESPAATAVTVTPPSAATLKAPTGLTAVTGPNSGEVTLRWDDPGNLAISGYQVRVAFDDNGVDRWGAWSAMAGSNHDTIRHVVKGLTADVLHAFTIRAVGGNQNDVHSPEATIVYATPPAASTLKAPTGLSATQGPASQAATLTWSNPNNPIITAYEYQIKRSTKSGWDNRWTLMVGSDANTVSWVFGGLGANPDNTYDVQLRAVVGSVQGPASATAVLSPPGTAVPIPTPTGLVATPGPDAGQVTLSWTNPNNNLVRRYQYRVATDDNGVDNWGAWSTISPSNRNTVRHTISGLTPNTPVKVTIRAVGGFAGLGGIPGVYSPQHQPVSVTPPAATTLTAPTGLTAVAGPNSGAVTLRWDDPGNLAISGYQVRVAFDDNGVDQWGAWSAMAGSNHDTVRHVVKGLTADVLHAFTIRAVGGNQNDVHSPEATIVYATPANDLPVVYWENNAYGVAENSGTFSPNIQVTKATTAAVTVNYTISGTAVCGTDYTISGADCATNTGSFAIPANTKPFTNITPLVITLTDDDTADSGETVILTLTEGSGYFLNSFLRPVFTLGLYDDTGAAAFSLGGTPELGETLTVTTTKDDPDGNGAFSYRWRFRPTPSDRWSSPQARARGCADDASSCTPVHSTQHPTVDGEFSVIVSYTDAIGFPHVVTTNTLGPITALPRVSFAAGSSTVAESGGTQNVAVAISPAPTAKITVSYTVGGTAVEDTDFSITGSGTVTVPANTGSVTIPVVVTEDTTDENAETVILTLSSGTGYAVGSANVHTLTIADNDGTNNAPTVATAIPDQDATAGAAFSYAFPANTFADADGDPLGYTATQGDDSALPTWLSFTEGSRSFSGTPQAANVGTLSVKVTATDGNGGSVSDTFTITVSAAPVNAPPVVAAAIGEQRATVGTVFRHQFPAGVFNDPTNDPLTFSASQGDDSALPAWLAFDGDTRTFSGTPTAADVGVLTVKVSASDGVSAVYATFTITVRTVAVVVSIHAGRESVMEGAEVAFTVTTDPAPTEPIEVMVQIRNSGDFAAPGERGVRTVTIGPSGAATFTVATVDDDIQEPHGRVLATVQQGSGYRIHPRQGEALTRLMDDDQPDLASEDKAKRAWQTRLGRTVGQQVVDAVQGRFAAPPPLSGLTLTVAGEEVTAMPLEENHGALSKLLGFETVTTDQLVEGSAFSFSPPPPAEAGEGEDTAPRFALWGQGAVTSFRGAEDTLSLSGNVTTALVGADWTAGRWQAGAALAHARANGAYAVEDDGAAGDLGGALTGLFPYGRYALTPRLGVWAVAGAAWGQLSLKSHETGREYQPAAAMVMGAVGLDGLLIDGGADGFSLSTTTDLLSLKTTTRQSAGLAAAEGSVSRLRVALQAVRPVPLPNGASLLPSLEVGVRHDGGDAETGFGLEVGAGLSWHDPQRGITAEVKGRSLLTHVDEEFREQGLALSFAWDPAPSNRGPALALSHAMGSAAEGGVAALLAPTVLEGVDGPAGNGQRFNAELAYGFPVANDRLTLTPALAVALSPDSSAYSLRWSLAPYSPHGHAAPWQLSIEAQRQEHNTPTPPEHSLKLSLSLLF